ncbi:hypothetical protein [Sulfurivermis fontis]|jgi:conjugal transfer pilus assembly protein TraA|uniref:hypothetical protein n=1 Tax=Sulfurivermis fontis TaxID=1972068 RepID=UPI000FDCB807|nr:hypothetical protein [Sulfurivermis fontis]
MTVRKPVRSSVAGMVLAAIVLAVAAAPALAGTGGAELQPILDWFTGLVQGTGGKLIAVISLLGAIAVTAFTFKVAGIGGLLFIVLGAAFGVAFINSIITAVV